MITIGIGGSDAAACERWARRLDAAANLSVLVASANIGAVAVCGADVIVWLGEARHADAVASIRGSARVLAMAPPAALDELRSGLRDGICGWLDDQADPSVVIAAIEIIAAGGLVFSALPAALLPGIAEPVDDDAVEGLDRLSVRETEALLLIARGLTHYQVGRRMGVSKATVDTYVERIRTKLHVGNKAELTRVALHARARRSSRPDVA